MEINNEQRAKAIAHNENHSSEKTGKLALQQHIYPIPLLTSPLKGEGLEKLP